MLQDYLTGRSDQATPLVGLEMTCRTIAKARAGTVQMGGGKSRSRNVPLHCHSGLEETVSQRVPTVTYVAGASLSMLSLL